jgi:hypothetical protein
MGLYSHAGIGRERRDRRMNKQDLLAIMVTIICTNSGQNAGEFNEESCFEAAEKIFGLTYDAALIEKETVSA